LKEGPALATVQGFFIMDKIMRVLRAVNLMGDSLYLLKPVAEFHMQRPKLDFIVGVAPGFAGDLFRRQFGGLFPIEDMGTLEREKNILDLSAGKAAELAVKRLFTDRRGLHISECYADMLAVDVRRWQRDFRPLTGWARGFTSEPLQSAPYVLIAPFSKSCSSHRSLRPNKTVDHLRWGLTIKSLEESGFDVNILVGPGEVWTGKRGATVGATALEDLVRILCSATYVISVDNGVAHIASALGCRTLILWPPITSIPFIGPVWNKKTTLMCMRPDRVRADQLMRLVQKELAK
jgi:hypothetical protein